MSNLYRKKPIVVKAIHWRNDGDHPNVVPLPDGVRASFDERAVSCRMEDARWIGTLEGGHVVKPGDWIITGVHGEQYPCDPIIFAKTYEPA